MRGAQLFLQRNSVRCIVSAREFRCCSNGACTRPPLLPHYTQVMDTAAAAMEKVPLVHESDNEEDVEDQVKFPVVSADLPPLPPMTPASSIPASSPLLSPPSPGVPRQGRISILWDKFLDMAHGFFFSFCHALGAIFLRSLSTFMLVSGIIGGVMIQMLAFYYTGVLNPWVLLSCLFYAPSLCAIAVVREEMLKGGTSRSGIGATRDTKWVTMSYLTLLASASAVLIQPLWMHEENMISVKSTWTSIGGTAYFFYSLLISEVLFGASINVKEARDTDREDRLYGDGRSTLHGTYSSITVSNPKGSSSPYV